MGCPIYFCIFAKVNKTCKILLFAWALILTSCDRKPLYFRGMVFENCNITTTIDITLDILTTLDVDINANLIYNWDETLYGPTGYTMPQYVEGVFTKYKGIGNREYQYTDEFEVGVPKTTNIITDTYYDILFYNKTRRTHYRYNENLSYYICSPEYASTKAFDFEENFGVEAQCEEQFSCMKTDVYVDIENGEVEMQTMSDGSILYHYNMDVTLVPITYIYIVQVIIDNDDQFIPMKVDSCSYMAINGVAREKELFTQLTTDKRCCVESTSVKPLEKTEDYSIFAERFVTYGLVEDYGSSWGHAGLSYELGMEFQLNDGTTKKGKVNITNLLNKKPKGGVITVHINNSDINRPTENPGGGFNVSVTDWENKVDVEIEI